MPFIFIFTNLHLRCRILEAGSKRRKLLQWSCRLMWQECKPVSYPDPDNNKLFFVLYFLLRLTLFSWCWLLLMMVMMALWMNRARVRIPSKETVLVRRARSRWRRTHLSDLEMLTWQVGWTPPRKGQRSWHLFPTRSSGKVLRRGWTWWKPYLIKTVWNFKVGLIDLYQAHWIWWRM